MKIISLNTWGCRNTKPIFDFIKEQSSSIDVFCLQEVFTGASGQTERGEITNSYEMLAEILEDFDGYFVPYDINYHYKETLTEKDYDFGLATYVRKDHTHSIVEGASFKHLNKSWNDYSGEFAAGATLSTIVNDYVIVNIHGIWQGGIKSDTEAKLEQSRNIISHLEQFSKKKIICGDFNLLPETKSIQLFRDRYQDLIKEYKITDTRGNLYTKELRHADYAFVDKEIKVRNFNVSNVEISDHLPMIMEF